MPAIAVIAVMAVCAVVETTETIPTIAVQQEQPHVEVIGGHGMVPGGTGGCTGGHAIGGAGGQGGMRGGGGSMGGGGHTGVGGPGGVGGCGTCGGNCGTGGQGGYGDTGGCGGDGGPGMVGGPGVVGGPGMVGGPGVVGGPGALGGPGVVGGPGALGGPGVLGGGGVVPPSAAAATVNVDRAVAAPARQRLLSWSDWISASVKPNRRFSWDGSSRSSCSVDDSWASALKNILSCVDSTVVLPMRSLNQTGLGALYRHQARISVKTTRS
jgi:hypothetical protein